MNPTAGPDPLSLVDEALARAHSHFPHSIPLSDRHDAVVMYHSVTDEPPLMESFQNVTPRRLQRDLEYLNSHFELVSLSEIARSTQPESTRVALTFDDGFANFATDVVPLLREYGAPATVFVNPSFVGDAAALVRRRHGLPRVDPETMLRDDQLSDLVDDLVSVGNHTSTHADLRSLNRHEQRREILGGKQVLEATYGIDVTAFSYPYGSYDESAVSIVRDSHDVAVTTEEGIVGPDADPIRLPRIHGGVSHAALRWRLTDARWTGVDAVRRIRDGARTDR